MTKIFFSNVCDICDCYPCECEDLVEDDEEEEVTWGADELGEEEDGEQT